MLRVGLTGGMGSGKATVARFLARYGACVVDADELAREAVSPGSGVWRELVREFGDGVVSEGGEIDRRALAGLVFEDPAKLGRLNAIVHPPVVREIRRRFAAAEREGIYEVAVADVPLLYEAGLEDDFDRVVAVTCTREEQLRRCRERDGFTRAEIESRLNAQMDLGEKSRRADYVIDNSGTIGATEVQAKEVWQRLLRIHGAGGSKKGDDTTDE